MKKIIPLIFIFSIIVSCKKDSSKQTSYTTIVDTITLSGTLDTLQQLNIEKTITIDTPSVIFFMPDYKERNQIIRFYGNRFEFDQIFNNFRRLAYVAKSALDSYGINSQLTYNYKFEIKTDSGYIPFNRKEENQIVGFILADGHKQPLIKFGVYRYMEFEKMIQQYFGIKNFKLHAKEPKIKSYYFNGTP